MHPASAREPVLPDDSQLDCLHRPGGRQGRRLAQRFASTIEAIARVNGLSDPGLIYVGQTLVIPIKSGAFPQPPTFTPAPIYPTAAPPAFPTAAPPPAGLGTYVVQRGDSLSEIAARYNTTVATQAQPTTWSTRT